MRLAWLVLVLTACDPPRPRDCRDCDPPLPRECPRACELDDRDCATFPYEQLPARCRDICYLGACCELVNGAWQPQSFDCARPRDAGLDAMPDGATDA